MEEGKKMPILLEVVIVLLLSYLVTILVNSALQLGLSGAGQADYPNSVSALELKLLWLIGEVSLVIVPFMYSKYHNYSLKDVFRLNPVPRKVIGWSVAIAFGIAMILDEIDRIIRFFLPPEPEMVDLIAKTMEVNSGEGFLLVILGIVIAAACIEEMLFRGMLQGVMEKYFYVNNAVVYGAVIWSLFHFNLLMASQVVVIFLFGIIAGYLTWRSNSIIPAIICHATNNSLAIWYYNTAPEERLPFLEWKGHVSPIVLLLSIAVVYQAVRQIDQFYQTRSSDNETELFQ